MKTIFFATTNQRKIKEARLGCQLFNVKIKPIALDIQEIQSSSPEEISKHKATSAYSLIQKPVVVSDSFWKIPALNGFPGGYMKDVAAWFSSEDFINLISRYKDKRISFTESVTYKDSSQIKIFSQEYWGILVDKPRGTGNSIENVAEFEGFTLGERRKQGGFSHKPEDYIWAKFAKWYAASKVIYY